MSVQHRLIGANKHPYTREENDFYTTPIDGILPLLDSETFNNTILEPACGNGNISKQLENRGYKVISRDLINRGYGDTGIDFLKSEEKDLDVDIITNPPFKYALEFVEKAIDVVKDGNTVAMLLKIQFLEGVRRLEFFRKHPPKMVYVFSSRICCPKNDDQTINANLMAYGWFIWKKGYRGDPVIKWLDSRPYRKWKE